MKLQSDLDLQKNHLYQFSQIWEDGEAKNDAKQSSDRNSCVIVALRESFNFENKGIDASNIRGVATASI